MNQHYPDDQTQIKDLLWQGSMPPQGTILRDKGFGAVVLCAMEHQPDAWKYHGVDVIYAPNDDNSARAPTRQELNIAIGAARQVTRRVRGGQQVLVTCMAGLNRSGLVSALTLHFLNGWAGEDCVKFVQTQRENALCNPQFVKILSKIKSTDAAPQEEDGHVLFLADGTKHRF